MVGIVRGVSLLFGLLLLVGCIPFAILAAGAPQGQAPASPPSIILSMLGCGALLASGFLYAPFFESRMRTSLAHRTVASLLLAVPVGLGALLLFSSSHPEFRTPALIVAGLSCLVFACLVWAGQQLRAPS
ncbi:hypothetical protein [Herbaspirillum sp. SJZ107]|uniref:hypothetical protein n=1 Tax=Herbaspirillum sp. SJZ107 TaxID=2572881 RepID=UPI00115171ED|nr:hypothetical protein [Herbaspirillum sp. SJZ107]TQK10870.1 hypothetical protein FBX97_0795 [Herbaspirillum sp. SJZ107]